MGACKIAPSDFGPYIRVRRENGNLTREQVCAAPLSMVPEQLEAIESGQLVATAMQREAICLALCRLEPHLPTCSCDGCGQNGAGEFAARAYMAGDDSAATKLSKPVVAALSAQRARARLKALARSVLCS